MTRRSPADKEYFLRDWFATRLSSAGYSLQAQGRNSTPDYIVARNQSVEGYELKSLEHVRSRKDVNYAPCRTDVDFNSSIPCGRFIRKYTHRLPEGVVVPNGTHLRRYYLFALYEQLDELHVQGIAFVLTDGDYLNNDLALAEGHRNVSERRFGSYGDAFIRIRQMYRFPNSLTDPDFRYRAVFISPEAGLHLRYGTLKLMLEKNKVEVATGIEQTFYAYEAV